MKVFKTGIIGYGGFGQFLHHHWDHLENVEVVAVADERAEQLEQLEGARGFSDWRDLIRESELDLVAVATIPATHAEIAGACLEAGKPVLVEKPLATTMADARQLIALRDKTNTVAAVDFIMRFNPLLQAIQAFSREGIFGKLRRVDVENYAQDEQLPPEHWFWNADLSGGILIEHGVHFIDLVHFLYPANILKVNGLRHERNTRQEDQIMANLLYEGGLIATHYHAFSRPGFFETTKIKLAYDLADVELHGWIPLWAEVSALVNPETRRILSASPLFELDDARPVAQATDESRPEGWGNTGDAASRQTLRSGGIPYDVSEIVSGKLQLGKSKQAVYGECVQQSLLDVLRKVENPQHVLAAPLETGLVSLDVAIRATASARQD